MLQTQVLTAGTEIKIPVLIRQLEIGSLYDGQVEIGRSAFLFEIIFSTPLSKSADARILETVIEVRNECEIIVKKNGIPLRLRDDEYLFFMDLLVPYAETICMKTLSGHYDPIIAPKDFDCVPIIGTSANNEYFLSNQICELLNRPKFNCRILLV